MSSWACDGPIVSQVKRRWLRPHNSKIWSCEHCLLQSLHVFFFFFWNVEFSKQNLNYIGVVCKTQLVLTTGLNPSKDQAAWWLPMEFWQCWACLSWCWGKFVWILGGDKASWWLGFTRIKSNGFENNCCPRGGGRKRVWLLAIFGSMIGLTNLGPTGLL